MENFTNETIDITSLPKFEHVPMTALHRDYWKVRLIVLGVVFLIGFGALGLVLSNASELAGYGTILSGCGVGFAALALILSRIGFKKKAFAFRNHDVLYRHGIIATTTIIIPYNRVQHVALHEGFLSRLFQLATIQIFTAGGSSSDLEIPGIEKRQAQDIKQLLMGKIQKEL